MLLRCPKRWFYVAGLAALLACADENEPVSGQLRLDVFVFEGDVPAGSLEYTIICTDDSGVGSGELRLEGSFETIDSLTDDDRIRAWSGFFSLPEGACAIQLRARDHDGEIICVSDEAFAVEPTVTQLSLAMTCFSFSDPIDPPFEVRNACPDLFLAECAEFADGDTTTNCLVRFRDIDDSCGAACDPQTCMPTPDGLVCTPGPDPGVSSTVTCMQDVLDCEGDGTLDASCMYYDTRSEFTIDCAPEAQEPLSGSVQCMVVTSDGDEDCNKVKLIDLTCP